MISYQKANYFMHRHLEGYDMARAIQKWNAGYPNDPTTSQEIEAFLVDLINRLESGMGHYVALCGITQGTEAVAREDTSPPLPPSPPAPQPKPVVPPKRKRRLFKKEG